MSRKRSVLEQLKRDELLEAVDAYDLDVADRRVRDQLIDALVRCRAFHLDEWLAELYRDRLKELCRQLDLDDSGRAKAEIVARLSGPRTEAASSPDEPEQILLQQDEERAEDHEPTAPEIEEEEIERTVNQPPTVATVLGVLRKDRLVDVGRDFDVAVSRSVTKELQIRTLLRPLGGTEGGLQSSGRLSFGELLRSLRRDELKTACRVHGLDASGRGRAALVGQLLEASPEPAGDAPRPIFGATEARRFTPETGDVVQVRQRQYLVAGVKPPPEDKQATLVRLVCLDDDNQGRTLEVLWELELGARVLQPEAHGLGQPEKLDPPQLFAAYLHALKWNAVTATEKLLFQAPFRAGISLNNLHHQLTPLMKALDLPRANLLIADDVGLGKTIEAGLVLQELRLRQRLDLVVVVCPAAICLQWRDEMAKRFGLHFEIYNRAFVAQRSRERGAAVNPWATHNRFVISYQTLRRSEYRDPLRNHLDRRGKKKSLLVLDEAHTAAPATASKYAVDSNVTRVVRDVAPLFENRLFLSATPHNGHSNSFSALLEILDRQRFTRGFPPSPKQLERVMVRRLKEDLREAGLGNYPVRRVREIALEIKGGRWSATYYDREKDSHEVVHRATLGDGAELFDAEVELRLADLLAEYTDLLSPRRGRGRLTFIRLQQRLLSSIRAFDRTLGVHTKNVGENETFFAQATLDGVDDDEYGDEDATNAAEDQEVAASSRAVKTPAGRAREILAEMQRLAAGFRDAPDAKVLALVEWIRRELCPAVRLGGAERAADTSWKDKRVILFTEWGDTRHYLYQILSNAFEGTDDDDERILMFYGGMSDEQREEIQSAFNAPPQEHPVRILIATDAAREGVNLQGNCADLFHYDVPWNPAKMEQRNGRIDRTLQQEKEVRCHYFVYPERREDIVLRKLVDKVAVIQKELGSLSAVVFDRINDVMERGIRDTTGAELDGAEDVRGGDTVKSECESARDFEKLRAEVDAASEILDDSRELMGFRPQLLRRAVDAGLALSGLPPLKPLDHGTGAHQLPDMPDSWQETLDSLRPVRKRKEPFWEWRQKKPLPVVFEGLEKLTTSVAQLHLEHPFVQRILSRFLSQGYSAHDLSRVTAVRNPDKASVQVIAFGRLSIFGHGATRLHDKLIPVAARWRHGGGKDHLKPLSEARTREVFENLERLLQDTGGHDATVDDLAERFRASAAADFAALWPHVRDEADHLAHEAERMLKERGVEEAEQLREILIAQREELRAELAGKQLPLFDKSELSAMDKAQQRQRELDREYWERRLEAAERELETEPGQIEELYKVALQRLEPVGMVYLC